MRMFPICVDIADARALPLDAELVDCVITSPPYGLDIPYELGDVPAPAWPEFTREWMAEAYRVARPGARMAVNGPLDTTRGGHRPTYMQVVDAAMLEGWQYGFTVVWNEGNVKRSVARGSYRNPHIIAPVEMIAVFYKGDWARPMTAPPDVDHGEWLEWTCGMWTFPGQRRATAWGKYPAAYPEELPRRLVKLLTAPGDVILDPFSRSGTTAAVACRLGRRALAFDVSPRAVSLTYARAQVVPYVQAGLFLTTTAAA